MTILRLRHFEKARDAAGCRQTAQMWEKLKRTDTDSLYNSTRMRAVTAAVFRTADKCPDGGKQADAEARTAVALAKPMSVRVDLAAVSPSAIEEIKQLVGDYPGPAEVWIEIVAATGMRRLRLGEAYRMQNTPSVRAELESIFASAPPVAQALAG